MIVVDDDCCWWWLMMTVVDDDGWWLMMMKENSIKLKIIKTQVSKISQVELSFFSIFLFFQKIFFKISSGEGWGVGRGSAGTWKPKEKTLNSKSKYFSKS